MLLAVPALARGALFGWAERGGYKAVSNLSGTSISVQRACPAANITVRNAGTVTSSTIYSSSSGTAKSNPFTATTTGYWHFYADDGDYDVLVDCGAVYSYTISSMRVISGGGIADGVVCDGVTDTTAAIQAAASVAGTTVTLPAGTCLTTDQVLINQHSVTIQGAGTNATTVMYMPVVDGEAAFKAKLTTASVINYPTFRNFSIMSADTTRLKIGIWLVDASGALIENVQVGTDGTWIGGASVSPFTGTGSIGVKINGREFGVFRKVLLAAAIPVYIGDNPNGGPDLDHWSFTDQFYFIAAGDNPNVYAETGLEITNMTFRNGAWVKGSYGFYTVDTTSVAVSSDWTFDDVRAEQQTSAGDFLHIDKNANLQGLTVSNIRLGTGTTTKGVYLDQVDPAIFTNYKYKGTLQCVRTNGVLDWRSSSCGPNSTKDLGSLVEIWANGFVDTLSPMPLNGRWEYANSELSAGKCSRVMGVFQCAKTGTLADASTTPIPNFGGTLVTGEVRVTFFGPTLDGGFSCAINGRRAVRTSTSDATIADCTGNVPGDITIDYSSPSAIVLRNNLGETVTYNWVLTLN